MQQDDALAGRREVADGFLEFRRTELAMVATEDEQVRLGQQSEGLLQVRRGSDVVTGGPGGQRIGAEEERGEVMRAAGAGEEHPELTRLTRTELLAESLRGPGVVLGQEIAGAFVGLGLLARLGRRLILAAGRVRRSADLDRHGDGGRGDLGVRGTQDELVDDLIAIDR